MNPRNAGWRSDQGMLLFDTSDGSPIQTLEFDIAITTVQEKETKGGIGVFVGAIGMGSQGQSAASNQSVSRMKFSIPVKLPGAK